jgi:chromosome segregation ATPase
LNNSFLFYYYLRSLNLEIEKKFSEERKAYLALENKILELEQKNKIYDSDLKFLNQEFVKLQKSYKMEQENCCSLKLELEQEIQKRAQLQSELSEMLNENSNLKIREKQLIKQVQDVCEESNNLKSECENLRKLLIDSENYKIKSIQDECDELKQMNQLYRSQRLELGEENDALIKQCDKFKQDIIHLQKEK